MTTPRIRRMPSLRAKLSIFERLMNFYANTVIDPVFPSTVDSPCWIWTGSTCNKGYGCVHVDGTSRRVHIVAWEIATGRKVRRGYTLDHRCRNKACWRPSHMQQMTRSANTAKGNRDNPRSTDAALAALAKIRALSSTPPSNPLLRE